jgi:hypothetical protein
MISEERRSALKRVLHDYVQSPSLQHLRDYQSINKLAAQILSTLVPERVVWTKWSEDREAIVRAAAPCWITLGGSLSSALLQTKGLSLKGSHPCTSVGYGDFWE